MSYFLTIGLGWILGLFIASFTLIQVGIILFFGIPVTRKFTKEGALKENNSIVKRYWISLLVLLSIYALVAGIIYFVSWNCFMGFLVGTGIILLLSLGKLGANKNNMADYLETNKEYFVHNST